MIATLNTNVSGKNSSQGTAAGSHDAGMVGNTNNFNESTI